MGLTPLPPWIGVGVREGDPEPGWNRWGRIRGGGGWGQGQSEGKEEGATLFQVGPLPRDLPGDDNAGLRERERCGDPSRQPP